MSLSLVYLIFVRLGSWLVTPGTVLRWHRSVTAAFDEVFRAAGAMRFRRPG